MDQLEGRHCKNTQKCWLFCIGAPKGPFLQGLRAVQKVLDIVQIPTKWIVVPCMCFDHKFTTALITYCKMSNDQQGPLAQDQCSQLADSLATYLKGALKKFKQLDKSAAKFCLDFPKQGRKGAEFFSSFVSYMYFSHMKALKTWNFQRLRCCLLFKS